MGHSDGGAQRFKIGGATFFLQAKAKTQLAYSSSPTTDTAMQIDTYRTRGMLRGVAVYNPPDYELRNLEQPGDVIEHLTGDRPWEAEDGTLSVEVESEQEAKAVAAYLRAYYEFFAAEPA